MVVFTIVAVIGIFGAGTEAGARPIEIAGLLVSAATAFSLTASRGERFGWLMPLAASALLLAALVVPALQPLRAIGHAGMAAALVIAAVQLHMFVVRGFRNAHV